MGARGKRAKAAVFDMDGVIIDSETHWKEVESEFLGGLISSWDEACQQQIIGMSLFDVYGLLQINYGLELSFKDYVAYYDKLALDIYGKRALPIDGVLSFIDELAYQNVQLGLASASPYRWIDIVLKRFSIEHIFGAVVSGEDFPGRGKPHPDIYLRASELIGRSPQECLAIEDSEKGVRSAKAAGLVCVALKNSRNAGQDLSAADLIINGFTDESCAEINGLIGGRLALL